MRPLPANRIGESHGILRALAQAGGRARIEEILSDTPRESLFPPDAENALGRSRQIVSFARSAGLVDEDRGMLELTEIGKRYVRGGDPARPFDVSSAQGEWLRRQLLDRHLTDTIFHGAAVALSLYGSNPGGNRVAMVDFGRALSHLGSAGWDSEATFQTQAERYTLLLRDIELIDERGELTPLGSQMRGELTLPVHRSLPDLITQLNPGGVPTPVEPEPEPESEQDPDGYATAAGSPAASAPVAAPPPAPAPAPQPTSWPEEPAPAAGDDDGFQTTAIPALSRPEPEPEPETPTQVPVVAGQVASEPALATAPPARDAAFIDVRALRRAADDAGLVLPPRLYANLAAALAIGKHVVLVGPPGAGKTTLALAICRAATESGRAAGAVLVTGSPRWTARHTAGAGPDQPGFVVDAAAQGRWLLLDELERADLDRALGSLSSYLGGLPVQLPGGVEATPPPDWRIVATRDAASPAQGSPALLRRFAEIRLPVPDDRKLDELIDNAAGRDAIAAGAVKRLLPVRELTPLGAGPFLDAARHAALRVKLEETHPATVAREVLAAHLDPLLRGLDDDRRRTLDELRRDLSR